MKKIPPFLCMDALRGVAALWVVMAHASTPFLAGKGMSFLNNPVYFVSSYGALGVVMFFVISGYCVTGALYNSILRGEGPGRFLHHRARRIYPPYLATCVLAVAASGILTFAQRHHLAPLSNHVVSVQRDCLYWISNLTLTQIEFKRGCLVFVFWSLCYEVVFYATLGFLYAAILQLIRRGTFRKSQFELILTSGVLLITLSSEAWLIVNPKGCPFPLDLWYQFGLGSLLFLHLAARCSEKPDRIRVTGCSLATAAFLTAVFAVMHDLSSLNGTLVESNVLGHPSSRMKSILTLLLLGFLMMARRYDAVIHSSRWVRPLTALGLFSYSLYLTHALFLPFVDAGLRRVGLDHGWYLLNYLAQLTVAVMAGFVFYHLVERHFVSRSPRKAS